MCSVPGNDLAWIDLPHRARETGKEKGVKSKEIAPKLSLDERNSQVVPCSAPHRVGPSCLCPAHPQMCKGCEQRDKKYVVPLLLGGDRAMFSSYPHSLGFSHSPVFVFSTLLVWQHFLPKYEEYLTACFLYAENAKWSCRQSAQFIESHFKASDVFLVTS